MDGTTTDVMLLVPNAGRRTISLALDMVGAIVPWAGFRFVQWMWLFGSGSGWSVDAMGIASCVWMIAYALSDATIRGTPGRRCLDLVVACLDGSPANWQRRTVRCISKWWWLIVLGLTVDATRSMQILFGLGVYIALFVADIWFVTDICLACIHPGRSLHDILAGTALFASAKASDSRGFPIVLSSCGEVTEVKERTG